ncbi:MAG: LysM peptidoglycan-binding domain-containing protein [Caldilinea sp. CFX5]|nr:LysM peptidoglycan-binding domain-containing protein [Caldilinea sp. CFX5]
MQEVVCYTCGRIVHISPDAELCSVCGENLRELLHPVHASKYFYDRAAKLAAGDQLLPALEEIDRGLRYQPSSELRLLGAILAKRLGDFVQMRYHVAAIPVDDVLRPEGEWLLRSHQSHQRELREATKEGLITRKQAMIAAAELPYAIQPAQAVRGRLRSGAAVAAVCLVILLGGAWFFNAIPFGRWQPDGQGETADSNPPVTPVQQPAQSEPTNTPLPVVEATAVLTPTATSTPNVPPDVANAQPTVTPNAIAANGMTGTVDFADGQPVDIQGYLQQQNRPDLAQLAVTATQQGGVLTLIGTAPSFELRQALLEVARTMPGVTDVNGVNLLLRPADNYVVQPGDTLWDISYRLYGDNKIAALLAANRAILSSPEALDVGMVLTVPPLE